MKRILQVVLFLLSSFFIANAQVSVVGKIDHLVPDGIDTIGNISLTVSGSTSPYTYTWTPGSVNTKDLSNIKKGAYSVSVKSASNQTYAATYDLGYKVLWTNLDRCTYRNDSLVASTASSSLFSRASSKNTLFANKDGWFEYVIDNISGSNRYIGFADSLSPVGGSITDIDYGIYFNPSNQNVYAYRNGTTNLVKSSAKVGDVIKVERVGNVISFKANGVTGYSVTVSGVSQKVFKLKACISITSRFISVGCSFSKLDSSSIINYVKVVPNITHVSTYNSSDGKIVITPKNPFANTYTWAGSGVTTNSITSRSFGTVAPTIKDSLANTSTYSYNIGYKVLWTNLDKCYWSNDSLVATTVSPKYSSAASKNTLLPSTDGWFEYVIDNLGTYDYYIGYSDSLSPITGNYKEIDYGIYYDGTSKYISYYEGGNLSTIYGTPIVGDVIRIERTGNSIIYKVNNVVLKTSSVTNVSLKTFKLKANIEMTGKLMNVGASFYKTDSIDFKNYVEVSPIIKHSKGYGLNDGSISITPRLSGSHKYKWEANCIDTPAVNLLSSKNYSITIKDNIGNKSSYSYNIGYKVSWINVQTGFFRNDTLKATTVAAGVYNYACSKNVLSANTDGWFEYVIGPLTDYNYFIGFTDTASASPSSFTDILYGIFYGASSRYIEYYESGSYSTFYATPREGDVVRIERVGNTINYKVNGALLRSYTNSSIGPKVLKLKAKLAYNNYLANVGCSFIKQPLGLTIAKEHPAFDNLNSGIIGVTPTGGKKPYTLTWNEIPGSTENLQIGLHSGLYHVHVTDSLNDTLTVPVYLGIKNNWRLQKNVAIVSNDFTNTLSGSDSSAVLVSNNLVRANKDGWTEITIGSQQQNTTFGFLGFSSGDVDLDYTIPHVKDNSLSNLLLYTDSLIFDRYSSGAIKQPGDIYKKIHLVSFNNGYAKINFKGYPTTDMVDYKVGDVFKIQRKSGTVSLYKNEILIASETTTASTQYLLSSLFVKAGTVSVNSIGTYSNDSLSNESLAGRPAFACNDSSFNWTHSVTYDENGTIKSESKEYMDAFGRTLQSQVKMFSSNNILVSQPLYDSYGRAVGQTLPAPVFVNYFCYVPQFIESDYGVDYSVGYFDNIPGTPPVDPEKLNTEDDYYNQPGDVNNPLPVYDNSYGKLGWYYSNNNSFENLVAADAYPYSRSDFYNDPLGRTKRIAGVGIKHYMGSGHESKMIYESTPPVTAAPDQNELNFVFPHRTYELENDFSVNISNVSNINKNLQLYKTISIDPDGKDQITYTNSSGQTIATCITGDGTACVSHTQVKTIFNIYGQRASQNLYVPKLKSNTVRLYEKSESSELYNHIAPVIRDKFKDVELISGLDYSYNSSTGAITFLGAYASQSLYLSVNYTTTSGYVIPVGNTINVSVDIDYAQWSLYFYDRKDRLLASASPNDVVCQVAPYTLQKISATPAQLNQTQMVKTQSQARTLQAPLLSFDFDHGTQDAANKEIVVSLNITTDTIFAFNNDSALVSLFTTPYDRVKDSTFFAENPYVSNIADSLYGNVVDSNLLYKNVYDSMMVFHNPIDSLSASYIDSINNAFYFTSVRSLIGKRISYTGYLTFKARIGNDSVVKLNVDSIPFNYDIEVVSYDTISGGVVSKIFGYTNQTTITENPIDLPDGTTGVDVIPTIVPTIKTGQNGQTDIPVGTTNPNIGSTIAGGTNVSGIATVNQYTPTPIPINLSNKYQYNEYDLLVGSQSEDEGDVDYVYDLLEDKLLFTQNDKQRASGNKFNCIVYDKLGRTIKTGEYDPSASGSGNPYYFIDYYGLIALTAAPSGYTSIYDPMNDNTSAYNDGRITQATNIIYDDVDSSMPTALGDATFAQKYTAAKVSKTYNDNLTTWYSYDELGRMLKSVQNSTALGYKTMEYAYDLRGKLLNSTYQKNKSDVMQHFFSYDADERLQSSYCGVKNGSSMLWKGLASYQYYLHGPLKRMVLDNDLQGIDYVYTIGGMLKSVNNPMTTSTDKDPGLDGYSTGPNSSVKPDLFAYGLQYYDNDYVRTSSPIKSYDYTSAFSGSNVSYSGLIKNIAWRTTLPAGAPTSSYSTMMYEYNYDSKGQLTNAQFGNFNATSASHTATFTQLPEYKLDNLTYDKNGNIQSLRRNAASSGSGTAHLFDDLTYNYSTTLKNRLLKVADASTNPGSYSAEFDLPNQTNSANYVYNAIGELVENKQENQGFEYDASGLVTRVYKLNNNNTIATFIYNDKGLRHQKISYNGDGYAYKGTYYSYDAGGALIATYENTITGGTPSTITPRDFAIYSAGQVGILDASTHATLFNLTDHLGNVRAVISRNTSTGNAETISYTDYYPHGGILPGRNYQNSVGSPMYYQGQEKDAETNLLNFELRQFDPRLGRWYNPDPMGQYHSPYLAMGNNPISQIDPTGGSSYDQYWGQTDAPKLDRWDNYNFSTGYDNENVDPNGPMVNPDMSYGHDKWLGDYLQSGAYWNAKNQYEAYMSDHTKNGVWGYRVGQSNRAANSEASDFIADESFAISNPFNFNAVSLTNSSGWAPLDKSTLKSYVRTNYCQDCGNGLLENKTGEVFEKLFEDFMDENMGIADNFLFYKNEFNKYDGHTRNTIPDFIGFTLPNGYASMPVISTFYELKASKNPLGTASFNAQVANQIFALSKMPGKAQRYMTLVTTSDVKISRPLQKFARDNGVILNHYIAQYKMIGGTMKINVKLKGTTHYLNFDQ